MPNPTSVYLPIVKRSGPLEQPTRAAEPHQNGSASSSMSAGDGGLAVLPLEEEALSSEEKAPVSELVEPHIKSIPAYAQASVEPSPALLRALRLAAPLAVVALDTDGCITMLNTTAAQLFGVSEGGSVGRAYTAIFGSSLANRMLPLFLRVARAKDQGNTQILKATLPTGQVATLRASAGILQNGSGQVEGILFVAEEVVTSDVDTTPLSQTQQMKTGDTPVAQAATTPGSMQRPDHLPMPASSKRTASIGGVRQIVTVLRATLAMTSDQDDMLPSQLRCYAAVVAALEQEGAVVDRYTGDGIVAVWNASASQPEHARQAIKGALALQSAVSALDPEMSFRVGIHSGVAVIGVLEDEASRRYMAVGEAVHGATYLHDSVPGVPIVCSTSTLAAAGEGIRARRLGPVTAAGYATPINAYSILGIMP